MRRIPILDFKYIEIIQEKNVKGKIDIRKIIINKKTIINAIKVKFIHELS